MNIKDIQNYILDMAMGKREIIPLSKAKIKGVKRVNIYAVNSKFDPAFQLMDVPSNQWKKNYTTMKEFLEIQNSPITHYIVVVDAETENNILYCCKSTK